MITAKSATQALQKANKPYYDYLDAEGDKQVNEAIAKKINVCEINTYYAKGTENMTKEDACKIAVKYYEGLGYKCSPYADLKRVQLQWDLY